MIDYITAKFPVRHDCASIAHFKNGYFKTWLRHKATAIEVTSVENGRFLVVSGNPVKYLQGHNIFGSNNLQGLCRDLIKVVLVQLGINLGRTDQQAINAGLYSLSRVDLAVNFRLPSGEMLSQAIREIEWHWRELGRNVSNYGDETVYHDQYSKVASTKFYNKAKEIRARPLPEKLLGAEACTRLRRYADRLLRAEFTLRSPALKTQRLNRGSEWTTAKTRALIQEKIASQSIQRKIRHVVLPEEYIRWRPELKQIYQLWSQGNDLRLLFEERTLQRRNKSLMTFGIDIRHRPVPKRIPKVSIQELLTSNNIVRFPRFARRLGLIHFPQRTDR